MKKQFLSIAVIIILVMSACAQGKKTGSTGSKIQVKNASTVTADVMATTANKTMSNKIEYISMERTNCFGTCPHYIIEMYESGLVRYSGKTYAEPKGVYEKNFHKDVVSEIFKEFNNFRVDTCAEEYTVLVSDFPGLTYIIKYESGKTQKIHNAHFGPDFLKFMGKEIDKKIKTDDSWKKVAEYNEEH